MRSVSVIICTYNPRLDYLHRVLDALKNQTFAASNWELLLMDNASARPLAENVDITWHTSSRIVAVEQLGKVHALLRAVAESTGDLIVIVDDDNVLSPDYLERATQLGRDWPILGAWGGSIVAEFEAQPADWARPYLRYLAIRDVTRDQWSNFAGPEHFGLLPWGAGMCVRRQVAEQWASRTVNHPLLRKLQREGRGLLTGEDTEMALAACDLGLGTGLFASLKLTHLIRAERVSEQYLLNLMEGMAFSLTAGAAVRGRPPEKHSLPRLLWGHFSALRRGAREFRFYRASLRGSRAAAQYLMTQAHEN